MKYKVMVSFGGQVNGTAGKEIEITDEVISSDLLRAGYIIPLEEKPEPMEEKPEPVKKTRRKKAEG